MAVRDLVIIGSGVAGWTAAIYAARAGIKPLVLTGPQYGGQMTTAGEVENFPGFEQPIEGMDLMMTMAEQAQSYGAEPVNDTVVGVNFSTKPFRIMGENDQYDAQCVVIATGASARWLGIPGEEELKGVGVSACATCDGYFFKEKDVAVVGGGNTAIEEALHLASLCRTVHLIHRKDKLRGEKILIDRLTRRPNVIYHWDNRVIEAVATDSLSKQLNHLIVENIKSGEITQLKVDGLFVAIGHQPATEPFRGIIDMDSGGYIKVKPGGVQTSVEGVLAAGDVADPYFRQAVTAAGMGCMAALTAEKLINGDSAH